MDINEIKISWREARNDINAGNGQPGEGRKTSLQRLTARYRRFLSLEAIFILLAPNVFYNAGIRQIWIIAGYVALMVGAGIVDYYLYHNLRAINLSEMTVAEVLRRTLRCRKIHFIWAAAALPFVILWIGTTAYVMKANVYFLYGLLSGGVIGLLLGLRVLRQFIRDYREAIG